MFYFALPGIRDIRGSVTGDNAGTKGEHFASTVYRDKRSGAITSRDQPAGDGPNWSMVDHRVRSSWALRPAVRGSIQAT